MPFNRKVKSFLMQLEHWVTSSLKIFCGAPQKRSIIMHNDNFLSPSSWRVFMLKLETGQRNLNFKANSKLPFVAALCVFTRKGGNSTPCHHHILYCSAAIWRKMRKWQIIFLCVSLFYDFYLTVSSRRISQSIWQSSDFCQLPFRNFK